MRMFFSSATLVVAICMVSATQPRAAEVVELAEANWDEYVPAGKEVDAIYGDNVLRSDRLVAVIAQAIDTRHANMTVKNVGGAVIDLTRRDVQSDQLSCYYPHAGEYNMTGPAPWPKELMQTPGAARLAFVAMSRGSTTEEQDLVKFIVAYELADGVDYLTINMVLTNRTDEPITVPLADGVRADGDFRFGHDPQRHLWWCHDEYWRGAYGLFSRKMIVAPREQEKRRPVQIAYAAHDGVDGVEVPARESVIFERKLIPAADTFQLNAIVRQLHGQEQVEATVAVTDPAGPVDGAYVEARQGDQVLGRGRTHADGLITTELPPGEITWKVSAQGRQDMEFERSVTGTRYEDSFELPVPGYVEGTITDPAGDGVPCKIAFLGRDGVADPDFGPDTAVHGVRNLWYTHDGDFRVEVLPGEYQLIISRGPEYDAVLTTVDVQEGATTRVEELLPRTVNTTGWISAELHSHSSPSGDNTSSQRGRVLNLLAEHLEFIPCTEHQRISTYLPHLEHFGATHRVLTCSGMELTGSPLPINHQNSFPLIHRPRTQDGGAPVIDANPVVQIARVAMWDDGSDKVVQINHPNIAQMVGDADQDGRPDEGFRKMFYYADVIEVHPPELIFDELAVNEKGWDGRGTVIQNWMQLLNLGYRLPGVVNTDAHWNFHGSGWLRNYIRSSTDNPAEADLMEICHALEKGQVVMTNGPFLEVEATAGATTVGPGEDLVSTNGTVTLDIRVECPNWLDVNRVQVFVNGLADERYNFTRRGQSDMFGEGVVKFQNRIAITLERDAHLIIAAAAEGRQLGEVFGPERGKTMPIAVSNPIFVDTDNDGFEPNGDMLGKPLPVEPDHIPTHGHDHPH